MIRRGTLTNQARRRKIAIESAIIKQLVEGFRQGKQVSIPGEVLSKTDIVKPEGLGDNFSYLFLDAIVKGIDFFVNKPRFSVLEVVSGNGYDLGALHHILDNPQVDYIGVDRRKDSVELASLLHPGIDFRHVDCGLDERLTTEEVDFVFTRGEFLSNLGYGEERQERFLEIVGSMGDHLKLGGILALPTFNREIISWGTRRLLEARYGLTYSNSDPILFRTGRNLKPICEVHFFLKNEIDSIPQLEECYFGVYIHPDQVKVDSVIQACEDICEESGLLFNETMKRGIRSELASWQDCQTITIPLAANDVDERLQISRSYNGISGEEHNTTFISMRCTTNRRQDMMDHIYAVLEK